jgi:uncharacterized membrane protein YdjX (TVP38/TMEM64 family)
MDPEQHANGEALAWNARHPMQQPLIKPKIGWLRSPLWMMAASMLGLAAIVGLLVLFDVHEQLVRLLQWIDAQGAWAAVLFVLVMAAVVVLLLPGIPFTAGAGFVFGVVEGTILVVLGTTLGATGAFLLARCLRGTRAARFITGHSGLRSVNREMLRDDGKVVLMTRLIPFFPSKFANYYFGLSGFSLRGFVLGSLVGFIPFSLHSVYLGSIAADLAALGNRKFERTPLEWTLYGLGFAATVLALFYLNRLARRMLARYQADAASGEGDA